MQLSYKHIAIYLGKMVEKCNLESLISFLDSLGVKWHITAGFALYLYGLRENFSDVDIRVCHEDLSELSEKLKSQYRGAVNLRPPLDYKFGIYNTFCIELNLDVKYDIYSVMHIVRDGLGSVEFPYDEKSFNEVNYMNYDGLALPVASLERLLAYYLVLRRDEYDIKMIRNIMTHHKFDANAYDEYLQGFRKQEAINQVYKNLSTLQA
jgi:hypothetical protein